MATTAERLVTALRRSREVRTEARLLIPEGTRAVRTYAGYGQRGQGAWVWNLQGPGGEPMLTDTGGARVMVGSIYRMTDLVAALDGAGITVDRVGPDIHIDPAVLVATGIGRSRKAIIMTTGPEAPVTVHVDVSAQLHAADSYGHRWTALAPKAFRDVPAAEVRGETDHAFEVERWCAALLDRYFTSTLYPRTREYLAAKDGHTGRYAVTVNVEGRMPRWAYVTL